ncbi:class I SAM-dependent methyltransferase, partial [bacterium]|nr:class I SAM-dependent methyltransferase [bacterium]
MQPEAYQLNYEFENSHWWFLARREIILSRIQAMIDGGDAPTATPLRILDFGCGTGGLTQTLERFDAVEGVDFSEEALDYCRKRGLESVRCIGSASDLASGAYDLIGTFDVLEHIEDDIGVLNELRRALTP